MKICPWRFESWGTTVELYRCCTGTRYPLNLSRSCTVDPDPKEILTDPRHCQYLLVFFLKRIFYNYLVDRFFAANLDPSINHILFGLAGDDCSCTRPRHSSCWWTRPASPPSPCPSQSSTGSSLTQCCWVTHSDMTFWCGSRFGSCYFRYCTSKN